MNFPEARYYEKFEKTLLRCRLCPHNCIIKEGTTGICGVRKNINNVLVTEIYGMHTAIAMDPIEKKPLYHFYPGTEIFSIGTRGCNLACPYCQNWHISQEDGVHARYYSSEEIIASLSTRESIGIAYTYSEPIIWFEYVVDTAKLARKQGYKNVLVTNGFINKEPLDEILGTIDAMNIDLKSFKDETYKKVQKGRLSPVINTIETAFNSGCHIEVTTLIVTGMNDDLSEMTELVDFIASVDSAIPWHISRYHPSYHYDKPATSIDFMLKVFNMARKRLRFVYTGNIPASYNGSDTFCPSCNELVIRRTGYRTEIISLNEGCCGNCGYFLGIRH